jgi:hypothetical protein
MRDSEALSPASVVVAAPDVVSANLGNEKALLSMADGVYYGLNPVGAAIWDLLQEPRTVEQLRDAIAARYSVELERCEREVVAMLKKLSGWGLIEITAA